MRCAALKLNLTLIMVSSFLLAATLGLVFVLHRIIGALRILRSVELEFYLLAWLLVES